MTALRLAVLASGRGSNLQALIDASAEPRFSATVAGVFSDRPDCGALAIARAHGIATRALPARDFATREAFDESLFSAIAGVQPDLIVCAGYMRLISAAAVRRQAGRMINLHPSLLPKFPGLHTHARALAAGETEHGASVHVVIPELDAGPVLAQARVPVLPGDDADTLAARVRAVEHPLLVATVGLIAQGRLQPDAAGPRYDGAALSRPLRLHEDALVAEEEDAR
jgi:phosphoribosylglycinamide formyltransferase-1